MIGGWFRPSGGLVYHWRARRHGRLWQSFVTPLNTWLSQWLDPKDQRHSDLVIVGPSGGYTLTSSWLRQFKAVHLYDADPWAGFFFRRSHPGMYIHFHRQNVFWSNDGRLDLSLMSDVLKAHPRAAILFSNVLGQVLLEGEATESEWLTYLKSLRARLSGRTWASYHDVLSQDKDGATDHLMRGDWTEDLRIEALTWRLTPDRTHTIEAVFERV